MGRVGQVRRSMTKYGRSPWIDRFPKSRIPSYPRFRGPLDVDVAIVGGGLTGCATAYAFAAAGVKAATPALLQLAKYRLSRFWADVMPAIREASNSWL